MGYNAKNIGDILSYDTSVNRSLIAKWNTVKDILNNDHIVSEIAVKTTDAEKYRFDLYGLIKNNFSIPEYQIYPHMIVNGYTSSYDYYGERLRFKIINGETLNKYYRMFTK